MKEPFWNVTALAEPRTAELGIYGDIDDSGFFGDSVSSKAIAKALAALGDVAEISVRINSPGGDVFAAQAIYSLLKTHSAAVTVHVDGLAASAASLIAMAGDRIEMPSNAMMMIHNPSAGVYGQSAELRKQADVLDKVRDSMIGAYQRSGKTRDEIVALLDAETWFTGDEAVAAGFADSAVPPVQIAACARGTNLEFTAAGRKFTLEAARYRHVPGIFVPAPEAEKGPSTMTIEELNQSCPDLLEQVRQEAEACERERIKSIYDLGGSASPEGYRAMFEEPVAVEAFAVTTLRSMKQQRPAGSAQALVKLYADGGEVPNVGSTDPAEDKSGDSGALSALSAAFKGGR
ncbi:MAG: Clp protease ClpP [Pyramidobacter sp.]|nr:Clp protease ClpP [Pyramidobacter sp.]